MRVEWFGGGESVSTPRLPPPAGGFFRNSDHGKQKFRIFCRKVILIPAQVNPVGVAVDGQLELLRYAPVVLYRTVPKLRAANVEDGLGLERASSPNQAPPPREFIAWIGDGTGLAASRVFSWLPCWNLSPMIAQSSRVGSTAA